MLSAQYHVPQWVTKEHTQYNCIIEKPKFCYVSNELLAISIRHGCDESEVYITGQLSCTWLLNCNNLQLDKVFLRKVWLSVCMFTFSGMLKLGIYSESAKISSAWLVMASACFCITGSDLHLGCCKIDGQLVFLAALFIAAGGQEWCRVIRICLDTHMESSAVKLCKYKKCLMLLSSKKCKIYNGSSRHLKDQKDTQIMLIIFGKTPKRQKCSICQSNKKMQSVMNEDNDAKSVSTIYLA